MMYCQLGRGMSDREIAERLIASFADRLDRPVHFVPPIKILPEDPLWQKRGVLG